MNCPNCGNDDIARHDQAATCFKCGWEKINYFPADEDEVCEHERTRMDDGISSCLDCGDRIDTDADVDDYDPEKGPPSTDEATVNLLVAKGYTIKYRDYEEVILH